MAKRRILVIDSEYELFDMVGDILAPFDFETQLIESDEDSVRMVKALRPDAVFVSAEISDKSRLSLCSKIKKAAGSRIPVILLTASLPQPDMALHSKERYCADAYLEMHELSSEQLYEKLDDLIGLSSNDKQMSALDSDATESGNEPLTSNGTRNTDSFDVDQDELNSDKKHLGSDNQDVPSWPRELSDKAIDDSAEDTPLDASQTKHSIDTLLKDDDANLKQKEIGRLKKQLNDSQRKLVVSEERLLELAKRLLSIQTEINQKKSREAELALGHEAAQAELAELNNAFEESRKRYDSKIEELEAYIAELKAEHEAKISQLTSNEHEEIRQFEAKLEQVQSDHQASLQKLKDEHQKEVDSLKKHLEKEKENSEARAKAELQEESKKIRQEHDAFVSNLKLKHADEIAELKSAISEAQNGADAKIEAITKDHEAVLKLIEEENSSKIGNLVDQFEKEKAEAVLAANSELQQALEKLQRENDELKSNTKHDFAFEMAKHSSAIDDAQRRFESEFNRLKNENLAALKAQEDKHCEEVEHLKKQIQEEKDSANKAGKPDSKGEKTKTGHGQKEDISKSNENHEEKITRLTLAIEELQKKLLEERKLHKSDLQAFDKKYKDGLHSLDVEYAAEIAKIREEKDAEIEALKKKTAEDV